jgi:hypothetical protein
MRVDLMDFPRKEADEGELLMEKERWRKSVADDW